MSYRVVFNLRESCMPQLLLLSVCIMCALVAISPTASSEPQINARQNKIEILMMKDVLQDLPDFSRDSLLKALIISIALQPDAT